MRIGSNIESFKTSLHAGLSTTVFQGFKNIEVAALVVHLLGGEPICLTAHLGDRRSAGPDMAVQFVIPLTIVSRLFGDAAVRIASIELDRQMLRRRLQQPIDRDCRSLGRHVRAADGPLNLAVFAGMVVGERGHEDMERGAASPKHYRPQLRRQQPFRQGSVVPSHSLHRLKVPLK